MAPLCQNSSDEIVILIPVLNPESAFLLFLEQLRRHFNKIVVVNDGSTKNIDFFEKAKELGATVLTHERNRGKGAAIKTGLKYIKDSVSQAQCAVTADADGQHDIEDVCKVAGLVMRLGDRLVIGERTFDASTPLASRFGNAWSKFWFRALIRIPVNDTQTGLRGIPKMLFDSLINLPGERYEYETYMLASARRHPNPPQSTSIKTIYNDNNSGSHFRRIRDSLRTQFAIWMSLFRT